MDTNSPAKMDAISIKKGYSFIIIVGLSCFFLTIVLPGPVQADVLPDSNYIFVNVANDAGAKYNTYLNNTYNIRFFGPGRGLNAHHITTDPVSAPFGQVTDSTSQSGVFYITDTGGSGIAENIIIMVAANGTIPDNFRVRIRTSGYNWTPMPGVEEKPPQSAIQYVEGAVDETFSKNDLIYGPQTWKPSGETTPFPIYNGQDMGNTSNTFRFMFVDAYVGQLGTNSGMSGLNNNGAAKVEYTIENMPESVVFNSYCWMSNAHQGPSVIAWTNNLIGGHNGNSGYSVHRVTAPSPVPLPGQAYPPTDPDHDGLYEDLSGNGQFGYGDVVLFFKNIETITDTEPVTAFDFSGNGAIGFQDVVLLFKEVP